MKVAIAGAGNVGVYIASDLKEDGHEVLVIEESVWESPIVVSLDGSPISVPLGLARAIRIDAHVEGGSPPPT